MKTKVIFISGIPATGKSTIAKKLALKLKIDKLLDLDVLKTTCKIFKKEEDDPYLYTTTHEATKVENLDYYVALNKYCDCIQNYLIELLSKFTNEKIILVEGAQLTPQVIDKLDKNKFQPFYFMLSLNEKALLKRIKKKMKIRKGKWFENFDKLIKMQNYLLENKNQIVIENNYKIATIRKIIKEIKNENLY